MGILGAVVFFHLLFPLALPFLLLLLFFSFLLPSSSAPPSTWARKEAKRDEKEGWEPTHNSSPPTHLPRPFRFLLVSPANTQRDAKVAEACPRSPPSLQSLAGIPPRSSRGGEAPGEMKWNQWTWAPRVGEVARSDIHTPEVGPMEPMDMGPPSWGSGEERHTHPRGFSNQTTRPKVPSHKAPRKRLSRKLPKTRICGLCFPLSFWI